MEPLCEYNEYLPEEEVNKRIEKFQKKLLQKEIGYCIIIRNVNIYYFTGTIQKSYLIIPANQGPLFLVQKDPERAKQETPLPITEIRSVKQIPEILFDYGLNDHMNVGLEFDALSISMFTKFQKIFGEKNFVDISKDLLEMRAFKSPYELEQMRKSGEICDHVFSKVAEYMAEGMQEVELSAVLQAEGRKIGHQGFIRMTGLNQELTNPHILSGPTGAVSSFGDVPLCGCGVTPAIAQGASKKKIGRNEPVIIDYGGGYNGYITDETRMYVIGDLDASLQKAYALSLQILEFFEDNACSGTNGQEIFDSIEKMVDKNDLLNNFMGYGRNRVSFVGHGIGLTLNELPVIAKKRNELLHSGMVIAVEPKFVFPHQGAVGVEADYVIQDEKVKRLTKYSIDVQYL